MSLIFHPFVQVAVEKNLKKVVEKIDPDAFIVLGEVRDINGGVIKKRPLKK